MNNMFHSERPTPFEDGVRLRHVKELLRSDLFKRRYCGCSPHKSLYTCYLTALKTRGKKLQTLIQVSQLLCFFLYQDLVRLCERCVSGVQTESTVRMQVNCCACVMFVHGK